MTTPASTNDTKKPDSASYDPRALPLNQRILWGLDDLAALTGLSRRTLERERSAGRLPNPDMRIGKRPMWQPATIRRWIAEGGAK